jgi:17beta-estradiol 17-dehydrogenase / very-long-chain 3-oxoacyl-CoA reductase
MPYQLYLHLLGILVFIYVYLKILSFAWLYLRPSSLRRYRKDHWDSRDGNWALVTGASDGIGQAFASELCEQGFNVVLHGRNSRKLERVQEELNQRFPKSQTDILVFDANLSPSSSMEKEILAKLHGLKLSVLINNIGGTTGVQSRSETYSTIDKHTVEAIDGIININARFTSQITRLLLPLLLKRPRSLILNVSSAAEWGMPYISVYAGTKAYITAWTKALKAEMMAEKRRVEVLGIVVGSVQTTSNSQPPNIFHPTARTFARSTMDRVGCGKASVYGYFPHALQGVFLSLPEWMARRVIISTMKARKQAADAEAKKL